MRARILPNNPFYHEPNFAFGYTYIQDGMRVLDYGCFDCRFGEKLLQHKEVDYVGADKNADALANQQVSRQVYLATHPLPFRDELFDVVVAFEVLEHVADQQRLLRELLRVLKPNGLLIVSVPRKHIFSFLDLANWKFVFPRIHYVFYRMRHTKKQYMDRYVNSAHGLVGDIEQEKRWHQHFTNFELKVLLEGSGFEVVDLDGFGLWGLPMTFLGQIFGLARIFTRRFRDWDNYRFSSNHLVGVAQKITAAKLSPG